MQNYDRFTDRSRRALQLAKKEAQRFGHEYVGTEHILLGLLGEGTGVAALMLKELGVDLRGAYREVESLLEPGPKPVLLKQIPQTPGAKHAIEMSIEEARSLNHAYIGSEHLLIGLLREKDGVATQALASMNVRLDAAREKLLHILGPSPVVPMPENPWLQPEPKYVDPAERSYEQQIGDSQTSTPSFSKLLLLMLFLSLIVNAILAAVLWQR